LFNQNCESVTEKEVTVLIRPSVFGVKYLWNLQTAHHIIKQAPKGEQRFWFWRKPTLEKTLDTSTKRQHTSTAWNCFIENVKIFYASTRVLTKVLAEYSSSKLPYSDSTALVQSLKRTQMYTH